MTIRMAPLALLLILASCERTGPTGPGGSERGVEAPPTISIAATGPAGCSASWNGEAVTPAQLTERSIAVLERAIMAVGGVQNVTEDSIPVPDVEAPAELGMACADSVLFAIQRSGFVNVRLKLAGSQASVLMDFPLSTDAPPPPVQMVLGLAAGGRLTWNGEPIDQSGLAARLIEAGGSPGEADLNSVGPSSVEIAPHGLELHVSREATIGQLFELLRIAQRYQLRPAVHLPSASSSTSTATPR